MQIPRQRSGATQQLLLLPEADLTLLEFLRKPQADALFNCLAHEVEWEHRDVFVWGAWHKQPRLTAWYGDIGAGYAYSGIRLEPKPWIAPLNDIKHQIEHATGAQFNSVLLNYYRDHNDGMGWHSDDEPELGPQPIIASLSLGEPRPLLFKHRHNKQLGVQKVLLPHGSLLVMAGNTQANWRHAIAKQKTALAPRINLTFRHVVPV